MSTVIFVPRPRIRKGATTEQVFGACREAAESPAIESCPQWVVEAIRNGKGGLKGRTNALWVLYLHELEWTRAEAQESWGAAYLSREHQDNLASSLFPGKKEKPSFEARKNLEDALWALRRLELDADRGVTDKPKGKRGSKPRLKAVAS